jgi:hypothetical protein
MYTKHDKPVIIIDFINPTLPMAANSQTFIGKCSSLFQVEYIKFVCLLYSNVEKS